MPDHTRPDRLRSVAKKVQDPADKLLAERLARLHELDERRRVTPSGHALDELEDEIAEESRRIILHLEEDDQRRAG
jgi:hypothetical protein